MPKFVKLSGSDWWYRWDEDRFVLKNFRGGWRDIDENSDEWMLSTIMEADSWHDLYLKTGFNPMWEFEPPRDAWLDREGNFYEGTAHELCAEQIIEVIWGYEWGSYNYSAADNLVANGWVKLTTSAMLPYYIEDGMYDCLSEAQVHAIRQWASDWRIHLFDDERWFNE